jgi:hypothetical protein
MGAELTVGNLITLAVLMLITAAILYGCERTKGPVL